MAKGRHIFLLTLNNHQNQNWCIKTDIAFVKYVVKVNKYVITHL